MPGICFRGVTGLLAILIACTAPAAAAIGDWWPFGKRDAGQNIPDPVDSAPALTVTGPGNDIEKPLRNGSILIERKATPASGVAGLIARAKQDVGQLAAVLYENGYYAGEIAIAIDGKPLAEISPFEPIATKPVPVEIKIETGPRFAFGKIDSPPMPAGISLERLGLVSGRPANSTLIVATETAIVDAWREQGHPLATARKREVVADHEARVLDVTLNVDAGPVANFGRVTIDGLTRTDRDLVVGRAAIRGGRYSSKTTKLATQRLRDLGVFDSVRITPAEALDPDGTIPITITVSERKLHVIGGSVFYSNTEGSGVEGYWRHRNLRGGAEQLEVFGSVSRLGMADGLDPDYRLRSTLKKPGILDALTDGSLRLEAYRQTTDAYRVTALEQETAVSRIFSETLSGSLGLEFARSRTISDATGTEDHLLATLRGKLDWDLRDNKLDPAHGARYQLLAAPAHDFRIRANFLTLGGDVSVYRAFGALEQFVLAGRVAATSLIAKDVLDVAADKRVYAGGAGSVRGYGWKNIAPRNADDQIIGGRSSIVLSGEVRYRINDQYAVAAFVDAGNATSRVAPSLDDMKVGTGLGLRYLTPVGPIRLDVAVPLQRGPGDPRVAIYVGLGQAF